ncbi:hypothetical protein HZR84_02250 [Hyphobacterium sp. CCMP332]|nr:hypothetical protein HZR84_02250 [Hyphobacterium sp. CCMP332]
MDKKRIVKDYDKLPEDVLVRLKQKYPYGYADNLVSFVNKEGNKVSALPFETEEIYYLIRMTISQANKIIEDDDDYDKDGNLKEEFALNIADSDFEDSEKGEEEDNEDDDSISVRLKKKKNSDGDDFDDEDDDPSESPDYY